jgi:uncharacterized protein (TIGR02145 family)
MMLAAQDSNGVKISNLAVSVGSPTTVTFNVSWSKTGMPDVWSDTVWVWVDYNDAGVMKRLPITSATASAGTVTKISSNDKGVWIAGNARSTGSFSATVRLLTATADIAGACAYASNYPSVGVYSSNAPMLSFTGTSPYEISLAYSGGESATVKAGDTFLLPCNYTPTSFTDATGAPGRLSGTPFNDNVNVPPLAASAKTWPIPDANQIWSDVINVPACDHPEMVSDNTKPYCRSYEYKERKWFYYNWTYVSENLNTLCPSSWHVPTMEDFVSLDIALGGDGKNRPADASWITSQYLEYWGAYTFFGYTRLPNTMSDLGTHMLYWTTTTIPGTSSSYCLDLRTSTVMPLKTDTWAFAYPVRCVR